MHSRSTEILWVVGNLFLGLIANSERLRVVLFSCTLLSSLSSLTSSSCSILVLLLNNERSRRFLVPFSLKAAGFGESNHRFLANPYPCFLLSAGPRFFTLSKYHPAPPLNPKTLTSLQLANNIKSPLNPCVGR